MGVPYEKVIEDEGPSTSVVMIDGPIKVEPAPPVRIRHYFGFSLFSVLCLCPATGLIALAYSIKSSAKADVKFHDKARLYARRALLWNLVSVLLVVLSFVALLLFLYYFNNMVDGYNYSINEFRRQQANEINAEINRMIQSFTNES